MIAQEEQEHNSEVLSREKSKGKSGNGKEKIVVPPAVPTPDGTTISAFHDPDDTKGWSEWDIRFMEKKRFLSPVSNTGATPRPPTTTKVDTISISCKERPNTLMELLIESLDEKYRGEQITWAGKSKGVMNGYKSGVAILVNKLEVATINHGCDHNQAQAEKPQIYIGGNGGTDHFDFHKLKFYLGQVEEPAIKRIDISKDWYFGEVTLENIEQAYIDGKFKNSKSRRNPKWVPVGAPNPIDGSHKGITYQIGSRDSCYFFRGYLKAYERLKSLMNCDDENIIYKIMNTDGMMAFDGVNDGKVFDVRKWLRCEVEIKSKNNVTIDLEAMIKPDEYYAGAYPYLSELINIGDGTRPKYMKKENELDLDIRIQNIKAIGGNTIEDMIFLGYSNEEIVNRLRSGKGASQKLIRSGKAQEYLNDKNRKQD